MLMQTIILTGGDDEVTEMDGPAVAAEGLSSKKPDGKDKKKLKSATEGGDIRNR